MATLLSDSQAEKLKVADLYFKEVASNGYTRTIPPSVQGVIKEVHDEFIHSPLNLNCGQCIVQGIAKLNYHLGEYHAAKEKEQSSKVEEIKPVTNEKGQRSNKGSR
jgi:hypothetical protein